MRSNVRLSDEEGRYLYSITCDQHNEMICAKQAEAHYNERGQWVGAKLVSRVARYSRKDYPLNPPSSISESEVLANVGLAKRDWPTPRAVRAAHEKVSAWPFVWDQQSAPAVLTQAP